MNSYTPELPSRLIEKGRLLFAQPCTFMKSVVDVAGLPTDGTPEVAFAGRSNVGKSSLINAVTRQNTLARTSGTPGHTQQLNLFSLGGKVTLIDLPGYGYAKAPKKAVEQWTELIKNYLRGRRELSRLFLLIDSRHGIKANDEDMMRFLDDMAVIYQIVLTKTDKLKKTELESCLQRTSEIVAKHGAAMEAILTTSSEKQSGIPELRATIASLLTD